MHAVIPVGIYDFMFKRFLFFLYFLAHAWWCFAAFLNLTFLPSAKWLYCLILDPKKYNIALRLKSMTMSNKTCASVVYKRSAMIEHHVNGISQGAVF